MGGKLPMLSNIDSYYHFKGLHDKLLDRGGMYMAVNPFPARELIAQHFNNVVIKCLLHTSLYSCPVLS